MPSSHGIPEQIVFDETAVETYVGGTTDPTNGTARQIVGNVSETFKDGFGNVDTENWDWFTGTGDKIFADGNVAASSFVDISKSVTDVGTTSYCLSKKEFAMPYDLMAGISIVQRMAGQEFAMEFVGVDSNGNVLETTPPAPVSIVGSITIASNVGTVTFAEGHGFKPGDVVVFYGNAMSALNVGPVVLTPINLLPNSFTFPCTLANGTYTAGGYVKYVCPAGFARQQAGIRWVGVTQGNADAVTRNEQKPMVVNWNPGNTQEIATIPTEGGINYTNQPYCVPFRPKGEWVVQRGLEFTDFMVADQDSLTPFRSTSVRRQNNPDNTLHYKLRFRATNHENLSRPVGAITSISKSGSTTATVTCPNHGLTTNDYIVIYGVQNQTNFANLTTATLVASVINANQFTIAFGASVTASSYGGMVYRVNGNSIGAFSAVVVNTYAKTSDGLRLKLVGNTNWTLTLGGIITLYGLVDSTNTRLTTLEGRYRVASYTTTTMELEPVDSQDLTSVSTSPLSAGGAILANTDFRLHYAKVIELARLVVEARRNVADRNRAMMTDAAITNTVQSNISQVGGSNLGTLLLQGGTNRTMSVGFSAPVLNADVTSAARTSSGNSGTISAEVLGGNTGAIVTVTANSGTNQTLDVITEESIDNGTTWTPIYHFERFTTSNTTAIMPPMPIGGRRRFSWVISGTTPSFTFKIDVTGSFGTHFPVTRQFFDRTANVLNGTGSAATTAYNVMGCKNVCASLTCTTVTTGGVYNLQFSNNNVDWYVGSADVTAVANSTVAIPSNGTAVGRFVRLFVKTAGSSQTGTLVSFNATN